MMHGQCGQTLESFGLIAGKASVSCTHNAVYFVLRSFNEEV